MLPHLIFYTNAETGHREYVAAHLIHRITAPEGDHGADLWLEDGTILPAKECPDALALAVNNGSFVLRHHHETPKPAPLSPVLS